MFARYAGALLLISGAAGCAVQSQPRTGATAPVGAATEPAPGGSHRYQLVERPKITWEAAEAEAAKMKAAGMKGHLVRLETATYEDELKAVHAAVFGPAVRTDKCYWIGASRPSPKGPPQEGWRWNDRTDVPASITATWIIDMREGRVPEGACALMSPQGMRVGDYAAVNPTGIVDGFIVELEPR